jgi:hypothetical protein
MAAELTMQDFVASNLPFPSQHTAHRLLGRRPTGIWEGGR